jgi:peptidoglycan/LPS O-acetylase OafA/YrhL
LAILVLYNQGILDFSIALTTLLGIHFLRDFNPKLGNWLGKISYSLYLTHALVGLSFINLMSSRVTSNIGKLIVELIAFTMTLIFSYFFWKYVENPSQNWSKKIKNNNSSI